MSGAVVPPDATGAPVQQLGSREFSVGGAIELARGIISRGFPTLLIASVILCAAMVPNWALGFAAQMSVEADRDAQERAVPADSVDHAASDGDEQGGDAADAAYEADAADADDGAARGRTRFGRFMMSEDVEWSPRTKALMAASNVASVVLGLLVHLPLAMGTIGIGLSLARGGSPRIGEILKGYRRLPTQILCYILQALAIAPAMATGWLMVALSLGMAAGAAMGLGGGSGAMGAAGLLLVAAALAAASVPLICLGAWLSARIALSICAVVDPAMGGLGAAAAIGACWRATSGSALGLIGLYLLCAVAAAFTAACCFVPFIVIGLPACLAAISAAWALLAWRVRADAPECIVRDPLGPGLWATPSAIAARTAASPSGAPPDFGA